MCNRGKGAPTEPCNESPAAADGGTAWIQERPLSPAQGSADGIDQDRIRSLQESSLNAASVKFSRKAQNGNEVSRTRPASSAFGFCLHHAGATVVKERYSVREQDISAADAL